MRIATRTVLSTVAAALAAFLLSAGPLPDSAAAGEKGKGPPPFAETDVCVYTGHGTASGKVHHGKPEGAGNGKGGGGGGKNATCGKTFAQWKGSNINVHVDGSGAPSTASGSLLADYSVLAMQEWACHSGLGESITVTWVSTAASADITIAWGDLGTSGVLGQAATSYFRKEIFSSAITMNSNQAAFSWTAGPAPSVDGAGCAVEVGNGSTSSSNYDLLSVLTHEIGHALGVSHPNNKCQSSDPCYPETMYSCTDAEEFMRRALDAGDRGAIASNYGNP